MERNKLVDIVINTGHISSEEKKGRRGTVGFLLR
jgi:hypothetical protein